MTAKTTVVTAFIGGPPSWGWSSLLSTRTGTPCTPAPTKSGDTEFTSSVSIGFPLFTVSNLCMYDSSQIVQTTQGELLSVGGELWLEGSGAVGSNASPISEAHIVGDWKLGTNALHAPRTWGSTRQEYAAIHDPTLPSYAIPIDWDPPYASARPGPGHGCSTSAGTPPTFDGNAVRDKSVGTFDLPLPPAIHASTGADRRCSARSRGAI